MIMHPRRSALLTAVVLLLVCAGLVLFASLPPAALPATAPPNVFSAERAMRHIQVMAQRPHPNGSAELVRVRDYLIAQLTAIGLEPQFRRRLVLVRDTRSQLRYRMCLLGCPEGARAASAVMLVAHYDGVGAGPAAGDDAAGVAVLLETLRALRAGHPLAHDVIVLFSDGEESGLRVRQPLYASTPGRAMWHSFSTSREGARADSL